MLYKAFKNSISTQINRNERGSGKGGEPEERCNNPCCKRIEKGEAEIREASKFETNITSTTYKHTKAKIKTWINSKHYLAVFSLMEEPSFSAASEERRQGVLFRFFFGYKCTRWMRRCGLFTY